MRISILLAEKYNMSRRYAKKAIKDGLVTVEGKIIVKDIDTNSNNIKYTGIINKPLFNIDDYILNRTDNIIFLYKPPFIHCERLKPNDDFTISDILETLNGYISISRLDYETDGVIAVINKNFKIDFMKKTYLAIVSGSFPKIINTNFSIDACNKKKVKIIDDNKGNSMTMKNIKENNGLSLIEITLEKAARHQIRATCDFLGYSILGDKIYNGQNFHRLCLHSANIEINNFSCNSSKYEKIFKAIID